MRVIPPVFSRGRSTIGYVKSLSGGVHEQLVDRPYTVVRKHGQETKHAPRTNLTYRVPVPRFR